MKAREYSHRAPNLIPCLGPDCPYQDPGEVRADVLVWGLRQIIEEVQSTQLYYDEDGLPMKRRKPKKKLKVLMDGKKK